MDTVRISSALPQPDPQPLLDPRRSPGAGWATASHLLGLLFTGLAPLVVLLAVGRDNVFARQHARQAVSFQLNIAALAVVGTGLAGLVPQLVLLFPVAVFVTLVLPIVAAVRAHGGHWRPYPPMLPFLRQLPEPTP